MGDCAVADTIGRPAAGGSAGGACAGIDAIERPDAVELPSADVDEASSLDLASVAFVPNPSNLRQVGPSVR